VKSQKLNRQYHTPHTTDFARSLAQAKFLSRVFGVLAFFS